MQKVVFYWIVLGSILFTISHVKAQSFKVQQFRPLPNDISAFINPEYDLNHEACALLKIVCEDRFAFSTPLGIIRRKNNVGEVWLYVPHNTRLITIKHPTWGVLRDYCLPIALESRMTYELVITPPLTVQMTQFLHIDRQPTRLLHSARMTALYPDALPISDKIQTPIKLETFVSATATIGNSTLLPGIRAGIMKKHGGYLSVHTDFGNWPRNQTGICDANGYLPKVILHTIQETHHQENCWLQLAQYTVYISYGIFTKESAMVSDEFIGNALQENGYAILPAPMKDG